jgi:hypothetical protein
MSMPSMIRCGLRIGFPRARRAHHPGSRVLLAALLLAAGCAYQPHPAVLEAGPVEWRAMVGGWRGSGAALADASANHGCGCWALAMFRAFARVGRHQPAPTGDHVQQVRGRDDPHHVIVVPDR